MGITEVIGHASAPTIELTNCGHVTRGAYGDGLQARQRTLRAGCFTERCSVCCRRLQTRQGSWLLRQPLSGGLITEPRHEGGCDPGRLGLTSPPEDVTFWHAFWRLHTRSMAGPFDAVVVTVHPFSTGVHRHRDLRTPRPPSPCLLSLLCSALPAHSARPWLESSRAVDSPSETCTYIPV